MPIRMVFAAAVSCVAAAAVVAAPTAAAVPTPQPVCNSNGAVDMCQSLGNVEINVPKRAGELYPYGYLP